MSPRSPHLHHATRASQRADPRQAGLTSRGASLSHVERRSYYQFGSDASGVVEWTMNKRVILITGANKGIGFEMARQLGKAGHTVLLGSRDAGRGETAAT